MKTDLHQIDHLGIGRAMMLKAIRARANAGDENAAADIGEALDDLELIAIDGAWWELIRRACWLAGRAERGNA
jgi:selenophosphate synthetase-related protein